MSMEVEHHEPEFHRRRFSHKPLQKLPKLRSTPRGLGNFILKPKYQFSLRGNIKDRRDLRGGAIFETPPLCLSTFIQCVFVFYFDLELLVDVLRISSYNSVDSLLDFIGILIVCELRRRLGKPHEKTR